MRELRRGARIAPRVLGPGRVTLLRSQAGPLAGDHDRVEMRVESGTLRVEPVAATVALPGRGADGAGARRRGRRGRAAGARRRAARRRRGRGRPADDDDPARARAPRRSCATSSCSAAPARGPGGSSRCCAPRGRRRDPPRRAARRPGDVANGRVRRARARAPRDRDGGASSARVAGKRGRRRELSAACEGQTLSAGGMPWRSSAVSAADLDRRSNAVVTAGPFSRRRRVHSVAAA